MITERLTYYLEVRNLRLKYQIGFRKGRRTIDPILCVESDLREAHVKKEVVVELLIKTKRLGISYEFLYGRSIELREGKKR